MSFVSVEVVRYMLESASSRAATGIIIFDASTLIHYALWFLADALALVLVVSWCTGKSVVRVAALAPYMFTIVWLSPVFDLILSGGKGFVMAYIFQPLQQLGVSFVTYFGPQLVPGITPGIRLEVACLLLVIFWYALMVTRSMARAALTVVLSYAITFFFLSLPSLIASSAFSVKEVLWFWRINVSSWNVGAHLLPSVLSSSLQFDFLFNMALAQIIYVAAGGLIALWWWRAAPRACRAVFGNSRWERVTHYLALAGLGILLGLQASGSTFRWTWLDGVSIVALMLAVYCAWMWAVGVNDLADVAIDKVSNTHRPLIQGAASARVVKQASVVFFVWAILGGALLGGHVFIGLLMFIVGNGLYSARPFRFKIFSAFASTLLAAGCLGVVLAGFFITSATQRFTAVPLPWVLLVFFGFTLGLHMKDVKDIAGDARSNIPTLLTRLGAYRGKQVVGLLLALSFCLAPIFLALPHLWFTSVPAAVLSYVFVNRQPYRELTLFLLYFAYLASSFVLILVEV